MSTDLQHLIRDFYLARLALLMRHEEVARHVSQYDANNAYQYIINREETHVSWLQHALLDLGAAIPADPARARRCQPGSGADAWKALAAEDARANQQFVDSWKPKVETVTHARHKGMLKVILGEMLEHKRIFDQAAAGREDLIGIAPRHQPAPRRRRQHPLDGIASAGVPPDARCHRARLEPRRPRRPPRLRRRRSSRGFFTELRMSTPDRHRCRSACRTPSRGS